MVSAVALNRSVSRALVIAYREDTSALERALAESGLTATVLRNEYSAKELTYTRQMRCLLAHLRVWEIAAQEEGLTAIMEADFVPCRNFGRLPLPFDPLRHDGLAWAFLYAGGPRIFRRFSDGSLQGHACTTVCYVVSQKVARLLCRYADEEIARNGYNAPYWPWDTQFQWHLMGWGALCFLPYRQYGEHGGMPNTEHSAAGIGFATKFPILMRLGIGRNHHADVLAGPLEFLPPYAKGSVIRFIFIRLQARLIGLLKLLTGRVVTAMFPLPALDRMRLYAIAVMRLCTPF